MKHAWHYMDGERARKRRERIEWIAITVIAVLIFAASFWFFLNIPGAI